MAEILIKAVDAHHKDPVKDRRGCYKRGDLIVCMRDGHTWGRLETIPKFWRVRVGGVDRLHIWDYCQPEYATDYVWLRDEHAYKLKTNSLTRRRWSFSAELIAPRQRLALYRGEIVNLTWSEFRNAMLDKKQWGGRKSLILEVA